MRKLDYEKTLAGGCPFGRQDGRNRRATKRWLQFSDKIGHKTAQFCANPPKSYFLAIYIMRSSPRICGRIAQNREIWKLVSNTERFSHIHRLSRLLAIRWQPPWRLRARPSDCQSAALRPAGNKARHLFLDLLSGSSITSPDVSTNLRSGVSGLV